MSGLGFPRQSGNPWQAWEPSTTPSWFTTMYEAEVAAQGVVYTDLESAMHGEYADMIRTHFMKLVKPNDHKFAALHGAVWSGGSFVYVPPGVSPWRFRCSPISG